MKSDFSLLTIFREDFTLHINKNFNGTAFRRSESFRPIYLLDLTCAKHREFSGMIHNNNYRMVPPSYKLVYKPH